MASRDRRRAGREPEGPLQVSVRRLPRRPSLRADGGRVPSRATQVLRHRTCGRSSSRHAGNAAEVGCHASISRKLRSWHTGDHRRKIPRNNHRSRFRATETSTIDVIGMNIRVLPLSIRISPGRFPSQDRAPVQASSPPTSSSSPPPTSQGPQSLVTLQPPHLVPAMPIVVARWPPGLDLVRRARTAHPVPPVHATQHGGKDQSLSASTSSFTIWAARRTVRPSL